MDKGTRVLVHIMPERTSMHAFLPLRCRAELVFHELKGRISRGLDAKGELKQLQRIHVSIVDREERKGIQTFDSFPKDLVAANTFRGERAVVEVNALELFEGLFASGGPLDIHDINAATTKITHQRASKGVPHVVAAFDITLKIDGGNAAIVGVVKGGPSGISSFFRSCLQPILVLPHGVKPVSRFSDGDRIVNVDGARGCFPCMRGKVERAVQQRV